jgi:AcrR family transcriptional regulator
MIKSESIAHARDERSRRKREAVETALSKMRADGRELTIKGVAEAAGVSRQYLYNNFGDELRSVRDEKRHQIDVIDEIRVPRRTRHEHQHVEALLRRKIQRLEADLKKVREETRTLRRDVESALGRAEHWRQLYEGLRPRRARGDPMRTVVPTILAVLEPYLDERLAAFDDMPESRRIPTLPATADGKINVMALVRDLGLNPSDAQHFHRKRELFDAVNIAAEAMGLAPIGSRALDDEASVSVRAKLARVGGAEKKASEDLVEALRRNDLLTAENERLRQKVLSLECQIASIYETGERPFHDPFGEDVG